jgi:4-amino-4-deoxy-L-arabinose transferase-like glycosyltransferase
LKVRIVIDFSAISQKITLYARKFNISHFLLLYFAAHMLQIAFPSNGGMVFDETYYAPASLQTLHGIAANAEHPPLPKIIGAIGIAIFGNNWFGWRFPQVIMQVVALYLLYLIAKRLLGDPWASGATVLLALDTIFFIHGGVLLIDMPSFLFGFLAIELYFRKKYGWSALSMGLAFFSREFGLFTFITLAVYHLAVNRRMLKLALKIGLRYALIVLLVFGSLFWVYDATFHPAMQTSVTTSVFTNIVAGANGSALTTIYSTSQSTSQQLISNPIQHILFMIRYQSSLGLNESDQPYFHPLLWILPVEPFNSPTYYRESVEVTSGTSSTVYSPIWYHAQPNLPLWYGIWPALLGLAYAFVRRKEWETAALIATGIASNYLPWVILDAVFRKIGFNYYMIYTLPYIALGLAFSIRMLPSRGKIVLALFVLAELGFFLWFFPVHPFPP